MQQANEKLEVAREIVTERYGGVTWSDTVDEETVTREIARTVPDVCVTENSARHNIIHVHGLTPMGVASRLGTALWNVLYADSPKVRAETLLEEYVEGANTRWCVVHVLLHTLGSEISEPYTVADIRDAGESLPRVSTLVEAAAKTNCAVGTLLRTVRERCDWTRFEAGKALGLTVDEHGRHCTCITDWETKNQGLSRKSTIKLLEAAKRLEKKEEEIYE